MSELDRAFAPSAFGPLCHRVVDALTEHLAAARRGEGPVLPWLEPEAQVDRWPADFAGGADALELVQRVIAESNHLQHPGYVGHQVSTPLPLAAVGHLVGGLLNSAPAVYEMGPVMTAMERSLVRWMGGRLGWTEAPDGVLTSGGSLGNLTCLLAARQARSGHDVWTDGLAGSAPLAVLTGAQAHYSVARALQIMGLGRHGAIPVPVDEHYRMRPDALDRARREAEADGRKVIAVVASSCSTATGAFDPLEPIAEFCERHGLWLHVDGAHGAAAALSERYRHLLAGLERADSVVWDAHKEVLTYANAGHNPPLLLRADGQVQMLTTQGIALGVLPQVQIERRETVFRQGDTLVLYTDGVTEAMNEDFDEFGLDRLRVTVEAARQRQPVDIVTAVTQAIHVHAGDTPQFDDITLVVMKR